MMTSASLVSSRLVSAYVVMYVCMYVVFGAGNSLPTPILICMYVARTSTNHRCDLSQLTNRLTKPEPSLPVGHSERARLNPGPRPAWSPLSSPLLPGGTDVRRWVECELGPPPRRFRVLCLYKKDIKTRNQKPCCTGGGGAGASNWIQEQLFQQHFQQHGGRRPGSWSAPRGGRGVTRVHKGLDDIQDEAHDHLDRP